MGNDLQIIKEALSIFMTFCDDIDSKYDYKQRDMAKKLLHIITNLEKGNTDYKYF